MPASQSLVFLFLSTRKSALRALYPASQDICSLMSARKTNASFGVACFSFFVNSQIRTSCSLSCFAGYLLVNERKKNKCLLRSRLFFFCAHYIIFPGERLHSIEMVPPTPSCTDKTAYTASGNKHIGTPLPPVLQS